MTDKLILGPDGLTRCYWTGGAGEYLAYHDAEWGLPVCDDRRLFEMMTLESFQSGLSWRTILMRRPAFREAFAGFDPAAVARFDEDDVRRLLGNAGIIRHRGKIEAAIHNARVALELGQRYGSLAAYVWRFEPAPADRPDRVTWDFLETMATSQASTALARELKRHTWRFFGPTTAYAFMQAAGLVNDHQFGCAFRERVQTARATFERPPGDEGV